MSIVFDGEGLQTDMVFDLGFHRGEDTAYYLAMGKRVVAVDASADHIAVGLKRFGAELANGQLKLVHGAVIGATQRAKQDHILFHPHPVRSEWGSVDLRWVRRNAEVHGLPHSKPEWVPAFCLEELVARYGYPSFLKIDIEGADEWVLSDLSRLKVLPETVSWETGKESFLSVLSQHRRLAALGYRLFRVVQQAYMDDSSPNVGVDGRLWKFERGCSGPLPEFSSLPWRGISWVYIQYAFLFIAYYMVGPRSLFRAAAQHPSPWIGALPRFLQRWADRHRVPLPGWVDSHAKLAQYCGNEHILDK